MVLAADTSTTWRWYAASWARRPPGLVWEDWQAWQPWLQTEAGKKYEYAYDVELPVRSAPAEISDTAMRRSYERSNARRIDAVGRVGDVYTIFEARRFTGWSAIAQLQAYGQLWPLFFPEIKTPALWLITERIADDIRASAARAGIQVWVVGE